MELLYIKSLHIIFITTWFAGLFYIVRLFIYHAETVDMDQPTRGILEKQYKLMSQKEKKEAWQRYAQWKVKSMKAYKESQNERQDTK